MSASNSILCKLYGRLWLSGFLYYLFFLSNWHKCLSFIAKVPFCEQYILDFIRMDLWLFNIRKFTEEGIKPGKSVTFQKNLTCLCISFICFLYWLNHKAMCFCVCRTHLFGIFDILRVWQLPPGLRKNIVIFLTLDKVLLTGIFLTTVKRESLEQAKKNWRLRVINIEDRNRENSSTACWTMPVLWNSDPKFSYSVFLIPFLSCE